MSRAAVGVDDVVAHRIVPVVVVDDPASAAPLAHALVAGGLPVAEVTLRTARAEAVLQAIAERGDVLVGAGTVVVPEQVDRAHRAGAAFVVSPGLDADVVARCRALGLPVLPGVATATEVMAARRLGLGVVKFFPAGVAGGPDALQALHAPFPDMAFVPTGGVRPDTLDRYLSLPGVPAVGGTWLAPGDLLRAGDFAAIEDRVRAAVAAVAALSRSPGHPGRDGVAAAPTRTGSGATDRG